MSGRVLAWVVFVAVFSALNYAARFTGQDPPEDILYTYDAFVFGLVQFAIILAIILLIARGDAARLFALRRPTSWGRAAGIAFGVFVGIFVLLGALSPVLDPGEEQGLVPERWEPDRAGAFAANAAVIVLLAPVVEELTFRGLGFSLLARYGRTVAILLVGLAFGLAHGLVEALPVLAVFGAGLAYLRSKTGSVYPPILVHGSFNAVALAASLAT